MSIETQEEKENVDSSASQMEYGSYMGVKAAQYDFQKWLLNDEPELEVIYSSLCGVRLVNINGEVKTVKTIGLMNREGAEQIVNNYLYLVSKSGKLTNFDAEEINNLMFTNMQMITQHLLQTQEDYALKEKDFDFVVTLIETYLKCIFNRSFKGAEQDRLGNTQKSIFKEESNTSQQPVPEQAAMPSRGGVLGFIK